MAKVQSTDDDDLKRVNVTGKVPPRLVAVLDQFGQHLRQRSIHTHGTGGVSNAIDALVEMAAYLEWFDNPDDFANKLFEFRQKRGSGK